MYAPVALELASSRVRQSHSPDHPVHRGSSLSSINLLVLFPLADRTSHTCPLAIFSSLRGPHHPPVRLPPSFSHPFPLSPVLPPSSSFCHQAYSLDSLDAHKIVIAYAGTRCLHPSYSSVQAPRSISLMLLYETPPTSTIALPSKCGTKP